MAFLAGGGRTQPVRDGGHERVAKAALIALRPRPEVGDEVKDGGARGKAGEKKQRAEQRAVPQRPRAEGAEEHAGVDAEHGTEDEIGKAGEIDEGRPGGESAGEAAQRRDEPHEPRQGIGEGKQG